ncbi:family 1 glycosylhydrolase [Actibacterium sp. 188UL27-1]|nr:family 1 glycosylhydrolase [Actibacterium sp. 188UL27-1]
MAHGKSVQAARSERSDIQMGVVLNAISTYPASDAPEDVAAAERHFQFHNEIYFGPMFAGRYGNQFIEAYGDKLRMQPGDLAIAHQPLDWWGFNYYYPSTVINDPKSDAAFPATIPVPSTTSNVRTDIGWEIKAEGLPHLLRQVYDRYDLPPCYITENGACYNTEVGPDGEVDDQARLSYLIDHIGAVADAIEIGIPVKGYFAWSLMDNYEWAEGYKMRFSIVHVDYHTQVRTLKKSGAWFGQLSADQAAQSQTVAAE